MIVRLAYNLMAPLFFLALLPSFIKRMRRRGGYEGSTLQRLGFYSPVIVEKLKQRRNIWIHAVSVGEMYVAQTLISAIREKNKDAHFVITTSTSTGYRIAQQKRDDRDEVFYFPLDFYPIVQRAIDQIHPQQVILVEGECWPNLVWELKRRNIPVGLVNGRLSDRSYSRYMKFQKLAAEVFGSLDLCSMQYAIDAQRVAALGAPSANVTFTGNIKYDFDVVENRCGVEHLFKREKSDEHLLLLGSSTWPGEELILGRLYQQLIEKYPHLMLVIAPRHVERTNDIEHEFIELGLQVCRRTSTKPANAGAVMLLDTTGELSGLYADADIVFVGKSLRNGGGQNPIEPAAYGCALITGPHMRNFKVESEMLDKACARQVIESEQELFECVDSLITNEEKRLLLSRSAENVYHTGRGATDKTVSLLEHIRVGSNH
jgi:3-deoxy-D-manno-octulosonic-acid transferase